MLGRAGVRHDDVVVVRGVVGRWSWGGVGSVRTGRPDGVLVVWWAHDGSVFGRGGRAFRLLEDE